MDIGAETVCSFFAALSDARPVIWNGPMGVLNEPPFDQGTIGIAKQWLKRPSRGAIVIAGGGDSSPLLPKLELLITSPTSQTGGGRTLEFLAGKELPGVTA